MLKIMVGLAAAGIAATGGQAQTPAASPAKTTALHQTTTSSSRTVTVTRKPAPRSAVSTNCSKEADAKSLHGKARKTFRADCMRAGGKN